MTSRISGWVRCLSMWEVSAEINASADPQAVWSLWRNAGRWKDWNDQIAEAELQGPFSLGTRARIRFKRSPRPLTFTIVALEPGRVFTDEARLPGARLGHEHVLKRRGATTTIGHRLYIDGPAEKIYALVMGRQMRAAVNRFGERERRLAEPPAS